MADLVGVACAREKIAVLVEGKGHDTVCGVKGLLHAIPVVNVNIDVQDALMPFEQFEDAEDDVVHVAEPRRLALLGMVHATRPVDDHVRLALVQPTRAGQGPTCVNRAVLVEVVEKRAVVLADVVLAHLRGMIGHVVDVDLPQEVEVVALVEALHLILGGARGAEHVHLAVEPCGEEEVVCEPHAVRLHRVPRAVVEVANALVVEVLHDGLGGAPAHVGKGRHRWFFRRGSKGDWTRVDACFTMEKSAKTDAKTRRQNLSRGPVVHRGTVVCVGPWDLLKSRNI